MVEQSLNSDLGDISVDSVMTSKSPSKNEEKSDSGHDQLYISGRSQDLEIGSELQSTRMAEDYTNDTFESNYETANMTNDIKGDEMGETASISMDVEGLHDYSKNSKNNKSDNRSSYEEEQESTEDDTDDTFSTDASVQTTFPNNQKSPDTNAFNKEYCDTIFKRNQENI